MSSHDSADDPIPPGSMLGVIGGGQLGRMFAMAARQMDYRVTVFSEERDCPAGQVADQVHVVDYGDPSALSRQVVGIQAMTYETENLPLAFVAEAARHVPVRPGLNLLRMSQHRLLEKSSLDELGLPVAEYAPVATLAQLRAGAARFQERCVLKTTTGGYDGKGQWLITNRDDLEQTAKQLAPRLTSETAGSLDQTPLMLERLVDFELEFSMLAARCVSGAIATYGPVLNEHRDHILDVSICPAGLAPGPTTHAQEIIRAIAEKLEVVGLFCVEFFLTRDQQVVINEIAPRPHNSGHLTIEAHRTSQFAQQVRTLCGMPLGDASQLQPAAMANLLGDVWLGGEPNWLAMLQTTGAQLHLYGKREPRSQRKMGHITATAETVAAAAECARRARAAL